MAAFR
ncbi:hypothetical protein ECEC1868_4859, partial [Escherichia coli EC1868]